MRTRACFISVLTAMSMLVIGGCGIVGEKEEGTPTVKPVGLKVMVPNAKGGGYDTTARAVAKVLQEAEIAPDTQVFNLPPAAHVDCRK